MKHLFFLFIILALTCVFSFSSYAEDCNIFIHGYTRKSEGYFGNLPRQVLWNSSLPIEESSPLVAAGILEQMKTCAQGSSIILRPHSYGASQVFYILGLGKRLQKLRPFHPYVEIYKKVISVMSYTGAYHGTPMMDYRCAQSKAFENIADWLGKDCVTNLSSSRQLDAAYQVTSTGVPTYLIYSTNNSGFMNLAGKFLSKQEVNYSDYKNGLILQNDNSLPLYSTMGCAGTDPITDPLGTCRKIDSNFMFDLFHETRYHHLAFKNKSEYMLRTIDDFLTDSGSENFQSLKYPIDVYKELSLFDYRISPIDPEKMENPLLRHYEIPSAWATSELGHFYTKISSEKNYFSSEKEAVFKIISKKKEDTAIVEILRSGLYDDKNKLILDLKKSLTKNSDESFSILIPLEQLPDGVYFVKAEVEDQSLTKKTAFATKSFSLARNLPLFLMISSDEISTEGNLMLNTKWSIPSESDYLIEAVLSNESKIPLVAFEEIFHLKEGVQNIPLQFDGFYFYLKNLSGFFVITQISLTKMNKNFILRRGELPFVSYRTQNYSWNDFRSFPKQDLVMKEKVRLIENTNK